MNESRREAAQLGFALSMFGAALAGCQGDRYSHYGPPAARSISIPTCPNASTAVRNVSLDTDRALTTEAGRGTGVFVEYTTGGHWHIWTACDTLLSGYGCAYDVTGQVIGGKTANLLGEELEASDLVSSSCADTAFMTVNTHSDFDGMWFDSPPGATVRVTAALGGALYSNLIYWVSEGVARDDANANPLELTPTAP